MLPFLSDLVRSNLRLSYRAMVHKPDPNPFHDAEEVVPFVDEEGTNNFISVPWEKEAMTFKEIYPSIDNGCGGVCTIELDDTWYVESHSYLRSAPRPSDNSVLLTIFPSLCAVTISETHVFDTTPSRVDVLSTLKIGAYEPEILIESNYTLADSSSDDVEVWITSQETGVASIDTIFKVTDNYGKHAYFKNMKSDITLGNMYTLRNIPTFMNLVKVELRDAEVRYFDPTDSSILPALLTSFATQNKWSNSTRLTLS